MDAEVVPLSDSVDATMFVPVPDTISSRVSSVPRPVPVPVPVLVSVVVKPLVKDDEE